MTRSGRLRPIIRVIDNLPMKTKLLVILALFSGIPVLGVGLFSYYRSSAIIDAQAVVYSESIVRQIRDRVDEIQEEIKKVGVPLITDPVIQNSQKDGLSNADIIKQKNLINTTLSTVRFMKDNIESIYICYEKGLVVSTETVMLEDEQRFKDFRVYRSAMEAMTKPVWLPVGEKEFRGGRKNRIFSYVRTVFDKESYQPFGVLVINIPAAVLDDICGQSKEYRVGIIDRKGTIIYNSPTFNKGLLNDSKLMQEIQSGTASGSSILKNTQNEWHRIQYIASEKSNWVYIAEVPVNFLKQNSMQARKYILLILLLVLSLSAIAAVLMSSYFIKPLSEIIAAMKKVQDGDFNVSLNIDNRSETGQLAGHYVAMVKKVNELIEGIKRAGNEKREAEITMLQAQITPHFLYNTLNSIKCMARVQKAVEIEAASEGLIKMLQLSISSKTVFITLEQELEIVRKYVLIQNFRYGGRIHLVTECNEDLLHCMVLKMTLQPLVENSILHGFQKKNRSAEIRIRVSKNSDGLCIEVEDNGIGMSPDTIRKVMSGEWNSDRRFNGIGINNIHERIILYFGKNYGLAYQSVPGEYTRARVTVPMIGESEVRGYV